MTINDGIRILDSVASDLNIRGSDLVTIKMESNGGTGGTDITVVTEFGNGFRKRLVKINSHGGIIRVEEV